VLTVKPGRAHAPSTHLPADTLPLRSTVGTKGELTITLRDNMGNVCIEGGAPIKAWVDTPTVQTEVDDTLDGSYTITWKGQVALILYHDPHPNPYAPWPSPSP
jgi:hypothetical protein